MHEKLRYAGLILGGGLLCLAVPILMAHCWI